MKRRAALKIRSAVPSSGQKRYLRRKVYRPGNVLIRETRSEKVNRMFEALQESGWKFKFTAEAQSPRGFKYTAHGESPFEAFLKAFGQWRSDLASFLPKIPKLLKESEPLVVVQPKTKTLQLWGGTAVRYRKELSRLYSTHGNVVAQKIRGRLKRHPEWTFEQAIAYMPKRIWDDPATRRLYMRDYRARVAHQESLVAA